MRGSTGWRSLCIQRCVLSGGHNISRGESQLDIEASDVPSCTVTTVSVPVATVGNQPTSRVENQLRSRPVLCMHTSKACTLEPQYSDHWGPEGVQYTEVDLLALILIR